MMKSAMQKISLPILGMSCASCADSVATAIRELPGVTQVTVEADAGRAIITFEPRLVDVWEMHKAVELDGYRIPTEVVTLQVEGMHCISCVAHIDGALGDLHGVLQSSTHLVDGTAKVTYVPGLVSIREMEQAVQEAGYSASAVTPQEESSGSTPVRTDTQSRTTGGNARRSIKLFPRR